MRIETICRVLQFDLGNYLTVKQIDDALGVAGVALGVGHHQHGGAFLVQLGERITSRPFFESRLPVGSSARISLGFITTARAMATRCC